MNQRYLYILVAGALTCLQPIKAERVNENVNDTIKTYNIGEVIVTSSTKETNDLRTLPGAVSILLAPSDSNQADRCSQGYQRFRPQPLYAGLRFENDFGHLYTRNRSA